MRENDWLTKNKNQPSCIKLSFNWTGLLNLKMRLFYRLKYTKNSYYGCNSVCFF